MKLTFAIALGVVAARHHMPVHRNYFATGMEESEFNDLSIMNEGKHMDIPHKPVQLNDAAPCKAGETQQADGSCHFQWTEPVNVQLSYDEKNGLWRDISLLQDNENFVNYEPNGAPEKLMLDNPGFFQHLADYNFPNMRTTFYNKKSSNQASAMEI